MLGALRRQRLPQLSEQLRPQTSILAIEHREDARRQVATEVAEVQVCCAHARAAKAMYESQPDAPQDKLGDGLATDGLDIAVDSEPRSTEDRIDRLPELGAGESNEPIACDIRQPQYALGRERMPSWANQRN